MADKDGTHEGPPHRRLQDPLHLPEILILIGRHLCQDDITSCVRVSRAWHSAMEPFLWKSVSMVHDSTPFTDDASLYPDAASMLRNVCRIKSLELTGVSMSQRMHMMVPSLQDQLVHLSVAHYSSDVDQILAQNSKTLQSFVCSDVAAVLQRPPHQLFMPPVPRLQGVTAFWDRMVSLDRLHTLSLTHVPVYKAQQETFFTVCNRLTSLTLQRGSGTFDMYPPTKQPFTRMRRLALRRNSMAFRGQFRFITQCPNLEHFAWISSQASLFNSLMFHITTLPEEEPCRIVSLDLSYTDMYDKDFAQVLSCFPRLKRLIAVASLFGESCSEQVVYFMSETLEELDVRCCRNASSALIQVILMLCKNLKRFRADHFSARVMAALPNQEIALWPQLRLFQEARTWFASSMIMSVASVPNPEAGSQGSEGTSTPGGGLRSEWIWACVGLEELELGVNDLGDDDDSMVDVLCSQLGALIHLRRLVLGWRCAAAIKIQYKGTRLANERKKVATLDLGLSGGLSKLGSLTKLRVLDVRKMDRLSLTVRDVRWVGQHWRSLRRIYGRLIEGSEESANILQLLRTDYPHICLSIT
ncbi:hypothetical protein BC939DRAFT_452741 [Gamsiella multidivaricata]|uniref:uncharacterized protein n=1 Tax=Gamsiella multidivaricata TaxID=101098 RepID=UPI00221E4BAC|nr:uncharacterized protein BC939DRAFT_452741 [Gamsiella multidivaricata]KAI7822841.1 hypothetical protein BC939DRAFT_452741 [Gamsiella multidivaricata]